MKTVVLSLSAIALLTACGGSGDGRSSNPVAPPPTVLSTFGDGAGVARATATENGLSLVAHVMAADIQNFALDYSVAFDTSGVTYQGSNAYGNSYDGYVTANGVQLYLWVFEDNTGEVVMAYASSQYENRALVGGEMVSNIPSGTYVYNGTNIIGLRDGSYFEDGTFAMNVNFGTGTASLSGSTASSTIGGTGISVNTSTGNFSGTNLTLTANDGVNSYNIPATIHGSFHGAGATAVSGLYYDTFSSTPVIAGGIVGTR